MSLINETTWSNFSLDEWLFWLENRYKQEIQLDIVRIKQIASKLELLNFPCTVITVAGTNGKGSTVAALESIYHTAGYNVATYTSPHLINFTERIRVNQKSISEDLLCKAFVKIEQSRGDIELKYFEVVTLAALLYFKSLSLDIIILEVGLGGRFDAVNIIDADLAIITTIDFDHVNYLGNNLELIGYEKAGILRPNQIFIYADYNPPLSIVSQAKFLKLNMQCLGETYDFNTEYDILCIKNSNKTAHEVIVHLPKINPKAAASAIIASISLQNILPVSISVWENALKNLTIRGRQEWHLDDVPILFDVAHNAQSVALLADYIKQFQGPGRQIHAVFSGLKDKDLESLIRPMCKYVDKWYPALLPSNRATSAEQLTSLIQSATNEFVSCFDSPMEAYQSAKQNTTKDDIIVVYGSFLTVAAVMRIYDEL